jgi:hypothetical protein
LTGWLAQAGAGVDVSILAQYGAIGVFLMVALGAVRVLFLRETKAHDLERQRADRLEEELRKLNSTIQDRYITTLGEASRVMVEVLDYIKRDG